MNPTEIFRDRIFSLLQSIAPEGLLDNIHQTAQAMAKTPNTSLSLAGLLTLADLTTIQQRTALTGGSSLYDLLILCPGIHKQQNATELHKGEYPAVAAMTTGYVFRVENPGTVYFLQRVARTGQLTTISVKEGSAGMASFGSGVLGFACAFATLAVVCFLVVVEDWWGVSTILGLVFARLITTLVIRARNVEGWTGVPEPGVRGDLLVLMSQDRWVRIRGMVDDLKAVTSGHWLREMTVVESWLSGVATMLVYLTVILASNASQLGQVLLIGLLTGSVGVLAVANSVTDVLQMRGRILKVDGPRKMYERRLDMAEELVKEQGTFDWAVAMGMISPEAGRDFVADKKASESGKGEQRSAVPVINGKEYRGSSATNTQPGGPIM